MIHKLIPRLIHSFSYSSSVRYYFHCLLVLIKFIYSFIHSFVILETYLLYALTRKDDYHFVCVCPANSDIRYKCIETYYYNPRSMYKFCNLLQTREKTHLVNCAKYLAEAFEREKP